MIKEKKILLSYFLYFILGLIILFVGVSNVFAETIPTTNYSTNFHFCQNSTECKETGYKESNYTTMNSFDDSASGKVGQFFTGFYSKITHNISANVDYLVTFNISYKYLEYGSYVQEVLGGQYINRFTEERFMHSNATISNATMTWSMIQNPVNTANTMEVKITLSYTIKSSTALSTLYLGSYSDTNYNFGFETHMYDTIVSIDGITIIPKSDDTIINQNQTIIDQNNQTNQELGDLNDKLEDTDIQGSLDGAGGFFGNFSSPDHGGLSGIITAPLTAINQMLNTTCNPMTATFKGKDLSLPCGYEFWDRLGAIQDFINVVLGGMLCYRIIIKLYKLIEKIKNPEDDRLEVMDL